MHADLLPALAACMLVAAFACGDDDDDATTRRDAGSTQDAGAQPFRLDGTWNDNGRAIAIVQQGREVVASYLSPLICDLENGSVPPGAEPLPGATVERTELDFRATLERSADVLPGDTLRGETSTCRHGFDPEDMVAPNGIAPGELTLTVVDHDHMRGRWQSDFDDDGTADIGGAVEIVR